MFQLDTYLLEVFKPTKAKIRWWFIATIILTMPFLLSAVIEPLLLSTNIPALVGLTLAFLGAFITAYWLLITWLPIDFLKAAGAEWGTQFCEFFAECPSAAGVIFSIALWSAVLYPIGCLWIELRRKFRIKISFPKTNKILWLLLLITLIRLLRLRSDQVFSFITLHGTAATMYRIIDVSFLIALLYGVIRKQSFIALLGTFYFLFKGLEDVIMTFLNKDSGGAAPITQIFLLCSLIVHGMLARYFWRQKRKLSDTAQQPL